MLCYYFTVVIDDLWLMVANTAGFKTEEKNVFKLIPKSHVCTFGLSQFAADAIVTESKSWAEFHHLNKYIFHL